MSTNRKILLTLLIGVIIAFKGYVIVIGQTKPVLVVLNNTDATLSIVDPATMEVTAAVATGEGPHEVVLSADGKTAYVANYGAQTPGSTFSIIDVTSAKELRRVDLLMVYGRYVFFVGDKLSHCGINQFNLVRIDGSWKIANGASTIDPGDCSEKEKAMKPDPAKWPTVKS
jgi:YVTN family beta-propeller protein